MSAPQPASAQVRLACDSASFTAPQDLLTTAAPMFWRAAALQLQLGLFVRGVLADVSALTSLTLEIKALSETNTAPAPDAPPLLIKTIGSFNAALTLDQWKAGADQHVVVDLAAEETNLQAGQLWLLLYGWNRAGSRIIFAAGKITCVETGGPSVGEPPPAVPTFLTAAETSAAIAAALGARVLLPPGVNAVRLNRDGTFDLLEIT